MSAIPHRLTDDVPFIIACCVQHIPRVTLHQLVEGVCLGYITDNNYISDIYVGSFYNDTLSQFGSCSSCLKSYSHSRLEQSAYL